jgi:hypothetical protein
LAYNSKGAITSNKASLLITGIEETIANMIEVYPNPTTDYVVVNVTDNITPTQVSVANIHGQIITEANELREGSYKIELSNVPPGAYIILIKTNSGSASRTIVKR